MPKKMYTAPNQRDFWDRWHERHTEASHTDHSVEALQTFIDALPPGDNLPVLEIGCGQGREAVNLAQRGYNVSAFDHSTVAIATAKSKAAVANVEVNFLQHDVTEILPYRPGTFVGVFAHLSLHYFDDSTTRTILREIARVLSTNGILFYTVRSVQDDLWGVGEQIEKNIYCTKGHVRHFFDLSYIYEIMSQWHIRLAEYYDTEDRTINPGHFIKVLAVRP